MENQKDKIRIDKDTKEKLEVKKALYGCTSYSKTVNVCIERLDAIEKMMDDCNGTAFDCTMVCASIYDLFNGGKR